MEQWKQIESHPDYEVSDLGNVRRNGRTLQPHMSGPEDNRYLTVHLYKDARRAHRKIHKLVAEAFIANPENKPEVHHKDENRYQNSSSNLEWVTRLEHTAKHTCKNVGIKGVRKSYGGLKPTHLIETPYHTWQVIVRSVYYGTFKTKEEAETKRDSVLQEEICK